MTFSITARCEKTNQLGVAVSTKLPAVGTLCPFAKAKIGAIATQSFVNPYIGINGIHYLNEKIDASSVLEEVIADDLAPVMRHVGIVDNQGNSAAFSGINCDCWFVHLDGDNYDVAGNMFVGNDTIKDMVNLFYKTGGIYRTERLMQS